MWAWVALGLAVLASFVVIGLWGRGETFRGDEWGYAQRLVDQSLGYTVLHPPPGKYLTAAPLAYYDLMFHTVGLSHYLPYRLVGIALLAVAAILFFLYTRRRVGDLVALPAAVVLLFLGAAWEVVAAPLRVPNQVAVVAGLGALVALDRPTNRRDVVASLLLVIAITSHPLGVAFVAAAAVLVVARPADKRWRSSWIFLVPVGVYGLWYLGAYTAPPGQTGPSIGDVIGFSGKSLAAFFAAATGFFRPPWTSGIHFLNGIGATLAIVFGVVVVWRLRRPGRVAASTWASLAALAALLIMPAFAPGGGRDPTAPRYLYPGVLVLFWVIFELARGVRVTRSSRVGLVAAVGVIFTIAMVSNLQTLHERAREYASGGEQLRVELAVLDIGRGTFEPPGLPLGVGLLTQPHLIASPLVPSDASTTFLLVRAARAYYRVRDSFGSPALTTDGLLDAPEAVRVRADRLLAAVVRPEFRPAGEKADGFVASGYRRAPGNAGIRGGCLRLEPGRADPSGSGGGGPQKRASGTVSLPPAGVTVTVPKPNPASAVRIGRFADQPSVPLDFPRRDVAILAPPLGAAPHVPWRMLVLSDHTVTVCGRPVL